MSCASIWVSLGPDGVAPGAFAGEVNCNDAAIGTAEGDEVEVGLGNGRTRYCSCLRAGLPAVATAGESDGGDVAGSDVETSAVQMECMENGTLSREVAAGLARRGGNLVPGSRRGLDPTTEAVAGMSEVGIVAGGDEESAALFEQAVEEVGAVGAVGAGADGHVVVVDLDRVDCVQFWERAGCRQRQFVQTGMEQRDESTAIPGAGDGFGVVVGWGWCESRGRPAAVIQ